MRAIAIVAGITALVAAGAVAAEPSVEIRNAAARVTIIPEARSDVQVTEISGNTRLHLRMDRDGDRVIVDGGLAMRSPNCNEAFGQRFVYIFGIGHIRWQDLPQLVIRVPLQAKVGASGAVWGDVGRGQGLDLANAGCGDWVVADQQGPLHIHNAGSGDVRAGSADHVEIASSGSSDIYLKAVRGGLVASISGSGDVTAQRVDGPLRAHISGSGDVTVKDGQVADMQVAIAGSGDVRFGGVAATLEASIAGSGDIDAAHVTGQVTRHIAGSGDVNVGH